MKRSTYLMTLVLAVMFFVFFPGAQSWAGKKIHQMTGDISAIDLAYNTVVVEVPLAGEKTFTVGGPLSSVAVLKKGNKSVSLEDFRVGDRVTVKWESTEQGHLILSLNAKQTSETQK
jgi:maltoporin